MLRHVLLVASCVICTALRAQTPAAASSAAPTEYNLQTHVRIPMRDGVHLNATLYKPVPMPQEPLPVIFMLGPYPQDTGHPSGSYFAARGYIYAWVDARGRGDSEGIFDPFRQEPNDGYDTVEWLAKQPWCNGKIAMFGGSYAGGDQWEAASLHPPHLTTIAPVASVRPMVDFPAQAGLFDSYDLQWLSFVTGHPLYSSVFEDGRLWQSAGKRLFLDKAAFRKLDEYAGNKDTVFQTWLQHPTVDDYWKNATLTREQVAGVDIPILVLTGARDGDQIGTLSFYDDYVAGKGASSLDKYFLVIGPWNHPGTRDPKPEFGGEKYGPASLLNVLRLHREWYDWTMKGAAKPAFLQNHVAYYVSGPHAECWKYADSLAAVPAKPQTLFLDATGGARSIYHSGTLTGAAVTAQPVTFLSDPNDLSGADDNDGQPGSDLHGDGLVFHTDPFKEDTEIDGKLDLKLWLKVDAPDTDLFFEVALITPDGKAHHLTDAPLRARYRNSADHPEPIHEGRAELYRFSPGYWFATRAPRGSQLRLIVGALNSPFFEKNWNSIKPVSEQTGADARVAHITLLQDKEHPSTLTIPFADPKAPCKASAEW